MIPYKWSVATSVPQNPEVRRDIVKAMQNLAADGDEGLRQRRAEIASIRQRLAELEQDFAKLCSGSPSLILSVLSKYGYNPDEPRVPKHNTGGGQWTRVAANDEADKGSDGAQPDIPFQKYGEGHHWVPKTVYKNRPFSKETKAVFDKARSGPLADPKVNSNNAEHIAYNEAVDELLDGFLASHEITEMQMTPAQATEFVQEVKTSTAPQIREFVTKINREVLKYNFRYGPWRRGGGGDEE